MIAFVAVLILYSTSAGSRLNVSGLMSANTGFAPSRHTALAVAKNVKLGTITSSPGPMPSAMQHEQQRIAARSAANRVLRPAVLRHLRFELVARRTVHERTRTRHFGHRGIQLSASREFSRQTSNIGTALGDAACGEAAVLAVCISKILSRKVFGEGRRLVPSFTPVNLRPHYACSRVAIRRIISNSTSEISTRKIGSARRACRVF